MFRTPFRVVLALALSIPSTALVAAPRGAAERLAAGERVFVGQVVDVSTRWGEGRKMTWTDWVFAVEETWAGPAAERQVVSVAGGTVDGTSILVSHGASFVVGETYLVSAWENGRLYSSAVVDGDRGYYRRAVDEATSAEVFLDPEERRLEAGPGDAIVSGRLGLPAGRPGLVRFPPEEELSFRRAVEREDAPRLVPVYFDPSGRRVAPLPASPEPVEPEGCPASRGDLRRAMDRARATSPGSRGAR